MICFINGLYAYQSRNYVLYVENSSLPRFAFCSMKICKLNDESIAPHRSLFIWKLNVLIKEWIQVNGGTLASTCDEIHLQSHESATMLTSLSPFMMKPRFLARALKLLFEPSMQKNGIFCKYLWIEIKLKGKMRWQVWLTSQIKFFAVTFSKIMDNFEVQYLIDLINRLP